MALRAVADEAHAFKVGDQPQELRFLLEYKFVAALDDAVAHLNRLINILGASSASAISEAEAARDDDEETLADIHLHAKLLLSGELIGRQ